MKLIQPDADIEIRSAKLLIFDCSVGAEEMKKIEHYCINAVESRKKTFLCLPLRKEPPQNLWTCSDGFRAITAEQAAWCKEKGLAMNGDDLMEVVKYFTAEGRDPNETELRILDTYWSDHCRHTTFTTELTDIKVDDSFASADLEESLRQWMEIRKELGRENKPLCLMGTRHYRRRYLRKTGMLGDLEQSEENNACGIYVDVDVDGETERWLPQFKNETHNHPTEIEPFGGPRHVWEVQSATR